jgi:DNA-directed RNA polymerase specialized sigma24 family protein
VVTEPAKPKFEPKKDWTLNAGAWEGLLAWLDCGAETDGASYLEMRRRLTGYFDRKNCAAPDDLADETLSRVARRLEEAGAIESETPARYCYIVARFVFLEHLRHTERTQEMAAELQRQEIAQATDDESEAKTERRLDCLGSCAAKMDPDHRELITRYYVGRGGAKIANRRRLAEALGVSMNALAIRACRIREKLAACVRQCLEERVK